MSGMWKRSLVALGWIALASAAAATGGGLTETESRWLAAGAPVLDYARQHRLPLDIVVQPQATPGHAPLAMGFVDGRCKLVFSMRGNPSLDATSASIPPPLFAPVVEAVTAHEIGHCWRYVRGVWHTLPAGFVDASMPAADDEELARLLRDMRETRREEGFADLVGLAWARLRHPGRYAEVHDWLTKVREHQPMAGAHHDTRVWVRLAGRPGAFGPETSVFEAALQLWKEGLLNDDD